MKKTFISLFAVAAFLFATVSFVGCTKDDDKDKTEQKTDDNNDDNNNGDNNGGNNGGNNGAALAQQDLIGEWTITKEDGTYLLKITADDFITSSDYDAPTARPYTFRNDSVIVSYNGDIDNDFTGKVELLDNKNVLVISRTVEPMNEEEHDYTDAIFFYKKGAAITSDLTTIQGYDWVWYLFGSDNPRVQIRLDTENHFELLVPVWNGENGWRGTYVYENGYLKMHVTELHSDWDDLGWRAVDDENKPTSGEDMSMPFFANGDVAYSIFANLYGYFVH